MTSMNTATSAASPDMPRIIGSASRHAGAKATHVGSPSVID